MCSRPKHKRQTIDQRLHPKRTWAALAWFGIFFCLLANGCSTDLHSPESVLNPAGPQAHRINSLTWLFLGVVTVVYVLVVIVLVAALFHRRHGKAMEPGDEYLEPEQLSEQRIWNRVFVAIAVTVVTLFVLLIADFSTGRALYQTSKTAEPLRIAIIGHQWWWEVHYLEWPSRFGQSYASNGIVTANEIHIPVDAEHPVMVDLQLQSHDVIHSFWVPALGGKKDLIPGHPTDLWIQADRSGTYWGECAEYCGYQHANMRLVVVAEPVEQFQTWLAQQRSTSAEPTTPILQRGRQVFLGSSCVMCHTIGGVPAYGLVGPNLTHVASRKIIAAGALQNTPGAIAGWVADPQQIKPGTQMPQINLDPADLRSLLEYLESLK